ncbi:MAG: MotA/TolQ/ExbB proton channel family protein [Gallionellaceae bacterium]|jgi:biopolymer transport protein ExbB|nr:MotA/TolQ/ExbB proton channel family protein [Gallionellaceae bacterium]
MNHDLAANDFGFSHFLSQTDTVGKIVLALLLLLSVASWYFIITKGIANLGARKRADAFLKQFWQAGSLQEMRTALDASGNDNAFAGLAQQALMVNDGHQSGAEKLLAAGGMSEYLTRVLRNGIDQESTQVESGLTVLASAGSAAPFIGLFGTVWGIYNALVQIGMSGQGTLDKVAGPVGEALIMTAVGLAVAIPAVLAYNSFTRRNRLWLAQLDNFAHDLYVLVTVGDKKA